MSTTARRSDGFVRPRGGVRAVLGGQLLPNFPNFSLISALLVPEGDVVAPSSAVGDLGENFGLPKKRSWYEGRPVQGHCLGGERTAAEGAVRETCGVGRARAEPGGDVLGTPSRGWMCGYPVVWRESPTPGPAGVSGRLLNGVFRDI